MCYCDESSGAIALVTSEVGDDLLAEASSGGGREQQEEEDDEEEEDADSSDTSSEEEESGLSPSERAKLRIQVILEEVLLPSLLQTKVLSVHGVFSISAWCVQ